MQINDIKNITQNLRDAGCDDETVESVIALLRLDKIDEAKKALAKHRDSLLGNVHKGEKCICCLDYFLYTLRKDIDKGEQTK